MEIIKKSIENYVQNQPALQIQSKVFQILDYIFLSNQSHIVSDNSLLANRQLTYQHSIQCPERSEFKLDCLWTILLMKMKMCFKIQVIDVHNIIEIKSFENNPGLETEVAQYWQKINLHLLQSSQGLFYIDKKTKFLPSYAIQLSYNHQNNLQVVFKSYIQKIKILVNEQTWRYLNQFSIIRGNSQMKKCTIEEMKKKLLSLKEYFETVRFNRSGKFKRNKQSKICLIGKQVKCLQLAYQLMGHTPLSKFKETKTVNFERAQKNFDHLKKKMAKNKAKQANRLTEHGNKVMTGILIQNIQNKRYVKEGGYGKISVGCYIYIEQISVNTSVVQQLKRQDSQDANEKRSIKRRQLVCKEAILNKDEAFKNEQKFIHYLRNQFHLNIANYYQSLGKSNFNQQKCLYLDYYEKNLEQIYKTLSTKEKLQIVIQISSVISFLVERGCLHRDLKEQNIMIDQKGRCKVIDFGSSCGFSDNPDKNCFLSELSALCSTPTYYFPYNQAKLYQQIGNNYTKRQYQHSPYFDLYSLGTIIQNMFYLHQTKSYGFIETELLYLSSKCRQINPEDRLDHEEVEIFLREVQELQKIILFETVEKESI